MTFHLSILPDETAYSYLVRWSWGSGYPDPRSALKNLLGTDNYQFGSSFPSYIPALHSLTGIAKDTLIEQHTILPFFRMFCTGEVYQKAHDKLFEGNAKNLHTRLSLVAGRLTQSNNAAYCSYCVIEDKKHFGTAYWHREHQLPGQILCVQHNKRLETTNIARRDFVLPRDTTPALYESITSPEMVLSTLLHEILTTNKSIATSRLKDAYRSELSKKGFTTESGRLRIKRLHDELKRYWSPIVHLSLYKRIFECDVRNLFPASLFYSSQSVVHPIKHALLIGMLFGSISRLLAAYDDADSNGVQVFTTKNKTKVNQLSLAPKIRATIVNSLQEGTSMRTLSRQYGKSISVIKKLAALHSVMVNTRAQKLFQPEIDVIITMAKLGDSTQNIADKFNCSVGAVEQIIGQQAGLVAYRHTKRVSELKSAHRAKVLKATKQFKTRSEIRQHASASYMYLYRHDTAWLYDTLPPAISRAQRYLGSKQ